MSEVSNKRLVRVKHAKDISIHNKHNKNIVFEKDFQVETRVERLK